MSRHALLVVIWCKPPLSGVMNWLDSSRGLSPSSIPWRVHWAQRRVSVALLLHFFHFGYHWVIGLSCPRFVSLAFVLSAMGIKSSVMFVMISPFIWTTFWDKMHWNINLAWFICGKLTSLRTAWPQEIHPRRISVCILVAHVDLWLQCQVLSRSRLARMQMPLPYWTGDNGFRHRESQRSISFSKTGFVEWASRQSHSSLNGRKGVAQQM